MLVYNIEWNKNKQKCITLSIKNEKEIRNRDQRLQNKEELIKYEYNYTGMMA